MALPSTIPTSFVPRSTAQHRLGSGDFSGVFDFLSYLVLVVVFVLSIGVFVYGRVLTAQLETKNAELDKAEKAIDPETIQSFVQLRDRLAISEGLLKNHVQFSSFFTALESLLPANVRLVSLHMATDDSLVTRVEGTGVAKSFNALAAASSAFASDGRIKDVIFSAITINQDTSVSFSISAKLDQKIVTYAP
jgi:Tfp pilus assembly protein PilN